MEEIKRKRGRPPGSKNKKTILKEQHQLKNPAPSSDAPRRPGRPRKIKNDATPEQMISGALQGLSEGFNEKPINWDHQTEEQEDFSFINAMFEGRISVKKKEKKKGEKWEHGTQVKYMLGDEWEYGIYCGVSDSEKGRHIVKSKNKISMLTIENIKLVEE